MTLSASPPPDPGDSRAGPRLRVIQADDIDIFTDLKWIQPGRFSDILYGYCHSLAETVAMKRLRVPDDGECSERDLRLFNEEAGIWHTLDHPHVLPLRGIYECAAGCTYLVSPYMDNGDLINYLKQNPLADRQNLLCDIASAIAYLHSLDIIHGDIKARNILVSQDGDVRLCDFGLSKYSSWTTSEGRKGAGTIRWQSPELLFDEPKSFKSDVYAFGITIYEVLSGNIPFGAASDGAIVYSVVLRNTRPPCLPKFSPAGQSYATTWALAKECWHRSRDCRPDMGEVWKRLEVEVFPNMTLKVLGGIAADKRRLAPMFKGGTSATGGVGPPTTASASTHGRMFTVDAAVDDGAEQDFNNGCARRHTIDIDINPHPNFSRIGQHRSQEPSTVGAPAPEVSDDKSATYANVHPEGYFVEDVPDEEEEEEEEFCFTPHDSPLLGATEGPIYRNGQGGLLPSTSQLDVVDEEFSLNGDDSTTNVNGEESLERPAQVLSQPGKHSSLTPKDMDNTKAGSSTLGSWASYLGGRNSGGRWMPWSNTYDSKCDDNDNRRDSPNELGQRQIRKSTKSNEDDDGNAYQIIGPDPGANQMGCNGGRGYYNTLISAINHTFEYTKSMVMGRRLQNRDSQELVTRSMCLEQLTIRTTTKTSIDWARWDGISVPSTDAA